MALQINYKRVNYIKKIYIKMIMENSLDSEATCIVTIMV